MYRNVDKLYLALYNTKQVGGFIVRVLNKLMSKNVVDKVKI